LWQCGYDLLLSLPTSFSNINFYICYMIIDKTEHISRYKGLGERIAKGLEYMVSTDLSAAAPGKHLIEGDDIFVLVSDYETKNRAECKLESHRKYIDIQYLTKGAEWFGYTPLKGQTPVKEYSEADDYMLFDEPASFTKLEPGLFAIFFPSDLHMPSVYDKVAENVRKIVIKVRI
jgi:YhcH/YjgK/YiaL family protein